jgi:hypothetical protein
MMRDENPLRPPARAGARRLGLLGLAMAMLLPSGCTTRRGSGGAWMAGMMGVMVVGGALLGTGAMHGRPSMDRDAAAFVDRFGPARLLEQRQLLELSADQVAALEALRDDVVAERRTAEEAARVAYELLRPVQRAAVGGAPSQRRTHH